MVTQKITKIMRMVPKMEDHRMVTSIMRMVIKVLKIMKKEKIKTDHLQVKTRKARIKRKTQVKVIIQKTKVRILKRAVVESKLKIAKRKNPQKAIKMKTQLRGAKKSIIKKELLKINFQITKLLALVTKYRVILVRIKIKITENV